MRMLATGRAATLRERGLGREIYRADEFPRLVDAALIDDDDEIGAQRVVYDQDMTLPHPPGWHAETVLVVTVNRDWGAAYYRNSELNAWITHNPRPAPGAPALLFDPEAGTDYPAEAAVPVSRLRRVVEEYLRTGERPAAVEWRPADRYLIY